MPVWSLILNIEYFVCGSIFYSHRFILLLKLDLNVRLKLNCVQFIRVLRNSLTSMNKFNGANVTPTKWTSDFIRCLCLIYFLVCCIHNFYSTKSIRTKTKRTKHNDWWISISISDSKWPKARSFWRVLLCLGFLFLVA